MTTKNKETTRKQYSFKEQNGDRFKRVEGFDNEFSGSHVVDVLSHAIYMMCNNEVTSTQTSCNKLTQATPSSL